MLRKLSFAIVGMALAASVSAADTANPKNLTVFNDVQKTVNHYAQFTIFDDVSATVKDGVVTLIGRVTMPYKKTDLEKRVAKVDGVRQVRNELSVLPVSLTDDQLRYRIARTIYGNPSFWNYAIGPNPSIHIIVEHGHVTLTGVVNSEVDRMLARSLANRFPAMSVTSELKTPAEVKEELEKL